MDTIESGASTDLLCTGSPASEETCDGHDCAAEAVARFIFRVKCGHSDSYLTCVPHRDMLRRRTAISAAVPLDGWLCCPVCEREIMFIREERLR
jgi:hypothetical protein